MSQNMLILMRGLPASGKTTQALALIKDFEAFGERAVRVSNDDISKWVFGEDFKKDSYGQVKAARIALVCSHFNSGTRIVILDNTNLSDVAIDEANMLAEKNDAVISYVDLTDVPLEVCLERNSKRDRQVPAEVMHRMNMILTKGE